MRDVTRCAAAAAAVAVLAGCGGGDPDVVATSSLPTVATSSTSASATSDAATSGAPAATTTRPAGSTSAATSGSSTINTPAPTLDTSNEAAAVLEQLDVKGRAPKTGYDRALFPHWRDTDGNGCDADDDTVERYASREMADRCRESAAAMIDPYTGNELRWGARRAGVVEIDHVVSLSDAWQKGAFAWNRSKRQEFANDPINLVPTAASVNNKKGDSDAATWLPWKPARCEFVARQIRVKGAYGLWVTAAERDAMARVLDSCPGQRLPGPGRATSLPPMPEKATPTAKRTTADAKPKRTTSKPAPEPDSGGSGLATCKDVKAAGLGPYKRGVDPEYANYRDSDKDGMVCE